MSLMQWFCKHKWYSHEKKVYEWEAQEVVEGTETWFHPIVEKKEYSETREIMVCEKCGKIEEIRY